jgi:hypothetical protein
MRVLITIIAVYLLAGCSAAAMMAPEKPYNEFNHQVSQYVTNWDYDYYQITGERLTPTEWKQFKHDLLVYLHKNYEDKPYAVFDGMSEYYEARILELKENQEKKVSEDAGSL